MNGWIRFTAASALALASLEGHAKVADKCIQTLAAQPTTQQQTQHPASRPCPMAIGYDLRQSGAVKSGAPAAAPQLSRTQAATEPTADAETIDPAGPALHV